MRTARGSLGSPRRLTRAVSIPRFFAEYLYAVHSESIDAELILSLSASPESLRSNSSLNVFRRELYLPRFFALIATSLDRSHISRRLPRLRYVTSSGFLNRPTSFSASELAGLFHPAATSRVTPVQGVLSARSHPSLFGRCAPAVGPNLAHRLSPAAARSGPRLRGLNPREAAFDVAPLFTGSTCRSPLRVHLLQARIFDSRSQFTRDLRSRRQLRVPSLSRSHPAPVRSVSPAEDLTDTSPFRPPARVFEPSLRPSV
jgi:hypothetical protein